MRELFSLLPITHEVSRTKAETLLYLLSWEVKAAKAF